MASVIEVIQDVVYVLAGEKLTIPADSIVQSPTRWWRLPDSRGMVKPMRRFSPGLPRQALSYGVSRQITVFTTPRRRGRAGGVP